MDFIAIRLAQMGTAHSDKSKAYAFIPNSVLTAYGNCSVS
jgi:hypothetical protein